MCARAVVAARCTPRRTTGGATGATAAPPTVAETVGGTAATGERSLLTPCSSPPLPMLMPCSPLALPLLTPCACPLIPPLTPHSLRAHPSASPVLVSLLTRCSSPCVVCSVRLSPPVPLMRVQPLAIGKSFSSSAPQTAIVARVHCFWVPLLLIKGKASS